MRRLFKKLFCASITFVGIFTPVTVSAFAQRSDIEGRWSKGSEGCKAEKNYNGEFIDISRGGFEFDAESGCQFSGGDTSKSDHWIMRGTCEYAGQYEGGGSAPVSQIELRSQFDVLKITIRGDNEFAGETSYVVKCD